MTASRRTVGITLDALEDLPRPCRSCVFWELHPVAGQRASEEGFPDLEKEAWLSATLLDWGSCGRLAYVAGMPAGFVLFAPPAYVPRAAAFPTSPVSGDAVVLMGMQVLPEFRSSGIGRMLIQAAAKDLTRRGIKAVEAFGDARDHAPAASGCTVPADFLLSVGFKTVRPHHRWPRLRLDLRTALSWREDVEQALERLLGSMTPETSLRPV